MTAEAGSYHGPMRRATIGTYLWHAARHQAEQHLAGERRDGHEVIPDHRKPHARGRPQRQAATNDGNWAYEHSQ